MIIKREREWDIYIYTHIYTYACLTYDTLRFTDLKEVLPSCTCPGSGNSDEINRRTQKHDLSIDVDVGVS